MMQSQILKFLAIPLFLMIGLVFISADLPTDEATADSLTKWDLLGIRKVNYGLDRDEIVVTLTEGLFSAVKLKVKHGGVNMHRMAIHYKNGDVQEVALKNNFKAGSSSRIIDLQGGKRVIRKVVFWYDTKNVSSRKATLQLWGRH